MKSGEGFSIDLNKQSSVKLAQFEGVSKDFKVKWLPWSSKSLLGKCLCALKFSISMTAKSARGRFLKRLLTGILLFQSLKTFDGSNTSAVGVVKDFMNIFLVLVFVLINSEMSAGMGGTNGNRLAQMLKKTDTVLGNGFQGFDTYTSLLFARQDMFVKFLNTSVARKHCLLVASFI